MVSEQRASSDNENLQSQKLTSNRTTATATAAEEGDDDDDDDAISNLIHQKTALNSTANKVQSGDDRDVAVNHVEGGVDADEIVVDDDDLDELDERKDDVDDDDDVTSGERVAALVYHGVRYDCGKFQENLYP